MSHIHHRNAHRYKLGNKYPLLALLVAAQLSTVASAQSGGPVDPYVGPWNFGENRCDVWKWGFDSESPAIVSGVARFYTNSCGAGTVVDAGTWGPPKQPGCGTLVGPKYTFGIESFNHKSVLIDYLNPNSQCQTSARDSLSIERQRVVKCPEGTTWNSTLNMCGWTGGIIPGKNAQCGIDGDGPATPANGNPIHARLGYKWQQERDFTDASGRLRIERFYTSASKLDLGNLGSNWRHNFERSIRLSPSGNTAYVLRSSGLELTFRRSGNAFVSDADISLRLTATFATQGGSIASWTLVDNRDQTEGYDAQGRLVTISYKDGQTLAFDYTTDGLLNRVRDTQGRSLWFTYEQATNSTALTRRARITSISTPDGKTIRYAYNSNGMLSQVIYPDTTPTVDTDNPRRQYHYGEGTNATQTMLTGITDESGQRYASWRYDAQGRAWLSVHGNDTDYKDRVEQIYNSNGTTTVRTFQSATTFVDNVQSFVTTQGVVKLAASTQPCPTCGGTNTQTTTYDANGNRDIATDFRGITTDYDIDVRGLETRRVEVANTTCPASLPNCLSNRRTIETDWHPQFREVLETRTRNATGTLVALVRFAYNTRGQRIANCQVDPTNSAALAYTCGSLTNAPVGVRQTRYTYCEAADAALPGSDCPIIGKPRTIDGPRTDVVDVTSFSYYAADSTNCSLAGGCDYLKGDLRLVTNALGHVQSFLRYDGAGRVRRIRDANGIITDLSYTPVGLLETRTTRFNADGAPSPMDATTRMEYEPYGALRKTIDADGVSVTFERDSAHRLVGVVDSLGNRIRFTLDGAGNRVREETLDSNGQLTRLLARLFDVNSRLRALIRAPYAAQTNLDDPTALKTTFTYDANGNPDLTTDPLGRVVDDNYDELNRQVSILSDSGSGGINAASSIEYDANDRIVRITDAKRLVTHYTYDGLGNEGGITSPDTGTQTFGSDAAGNRIRSTDARGISSTRRFDALNRIIAVEFPTPSENVTFTWDSVPTTCPAGERSGVGRMAGFVDESGYTEFCYDLRGNLVRKIQKTASSDFVTRYQYSLANRVMSITYPSGLQIAFGRNVAGRVSSIEYAVSGGNQDVLVASTNYMPFGPLAALQWGNGHGYTRRYDLNYAIDRIDSLALQGLNADYGFDERGNLTAIATSTGSTSYGYDALGRLLSDNSTGGVRTYTYDATGNRTSASGISYSYSADSHRLDSVGAALRSYDAAGNLLNPSRYDRSGNSFRYNQRNRLAARVSNGGDRDLYQYNARGERVRKQDLVGGTDRLFVYDESGRLLGEYLSDRTPIWEYVWLGDTPIAAVRGKGWSAIESDHLGTPRRLIDGQTGVVTWTWDVRSEAFGLGAPNADPDGDGKQEEFNLRFPGQYYDRESGLHYNYFRDYEPATGRYVESDPIGLQGGISTYGYALGRPLTLTDAKGLDAWCGSGARWVPDPGTSPGDMKGHCEPDPNEPGTDCPSGECAFFDPDVNCACTLDCMEKSKWARRLCMLRPGGKQMCDATAALNCSRKCKGKCDGSGAGAGDNPASCSP